MAAEVMVHSVSRKVTFGFGVARYPIMHIYNQFKKILNLLLVLWKKLLKDSQTGWLAIKM